MLLDYLCDSSMNYHAIELWTVKRLCFCFFKVGIGLSLLISNKDRRHMENRSNFTPIEATRPQPGCEEWPYSGKPHCRFQYKRLTSVRFSCNTYSVILI